MKRILFFLPALFMMGCGSTQQQEAVKHLVLNDTLKVGGHTCTLNVDAMLTDGSDSAEQKINDALALFYFFQEGGPKKAMEAWRDSVAKEYTQFVNESDYDGPMDWSYEIKAYEIESKQGVRSFVQDFYEYTGGAHGLYGKFYDHFDAVTGEEVDFEEVLDCSAEELLPLIQTEFAEQLGIPVEGLEEAGYWAPDNWTVPSNFYLRGDSVYFYFNVYEAACYAAGPVEVGMPLKKLKP